MTIRQLGNNIVQQQTSVESNNLTTAPTQQEALTAETTSPTLVSEAEKASRFQETGMQGLAMRSFLDSGLPTPKNSVGIWDNDFDVPLNVLNPMVVEANAAEKTLSAMSNEELLLLTETPAGEQALAAFAKTIKDGGDVTPAAQKQLDRIAAAQFKPGPGLKLDVVPPEKSDEYQASYLRAVRRTMMESPSFAKNMNEINNGTPPVKILLGRNLPTSLDSFNQGKQQILDLTDLERIPATPPLTHPESTTQGQVLTHVMREAQEGARQTLHGQPDVDAAHKAAVKAENEYRADIGQKTMRLTEKDETYIETPPLGHTLLIHYDDGHSDGLLFDNNGSLTAVNGNIFIPF
jgi:hypothetical protein